MNYASLLSFFHSKINGHFLKKTEINPEAHTLNQGTAVLSWQKEHKAVSAS